MRLSGVIAVVLSLAGCSGSPTPMGVGGQGMGGSSGAGGNTGGAGPIGDAGVLVGLFQVLHSTSDVANSAGVLGRVSDGPTPPVKTFRVDQRDGDCRLDIPQVTFCPTPCGSSAACVADGVCQPYPRSRNVGAVRLSGVRVENMAGAAAIDLTSVNNNYQVPATFTLLRPPFIDGEAIAVTANGGPEVSSFSLSTLGVASVQLSANRYPFAPNMPLTLGWTVGRANPTARIEVEIDISHHGGLKGQIVCDTDDDGSLTVSAALVTRLINLGVAGFPTVQVRRVSTASTLVQSGRVDLKVFSSVERPLDIPGLVSCTDSMGCPSGQACQPDLKCM